MRAAVKHPHQRGYVLVLTLMAIAIAGVLAAAVARTAMEQSAQASQRIVEMQRHWGLLSCQAFILPKAEDILASHEAAQRESIPTLREKFRLGDQTFTLILSDENAKVDPRFVISRKGAEDAHHAMIDLLGNNPLAAKLQLRSSSAPAPQTFGELFGPLTPNALWAGDDESAANTVTFWTNGQINIRRAPESVLTTSCSGTISPALLHLIAKTEATWPQPPLQSVLNKLNVSVDQQKKMARYLTDRSTSYSLWMISEKDSHDQAIRFAVSGQMSADPVDVATYVFEW